MKAIELLVSYLEEMEVEYIFGIPGGVLEPLNNAIFKSDKITGIVTRHEQGAAFMADGYARVKKTFGVCASTAGPGATNLITGVATAYTDSVPLIVLTGQVATPYFGQGAFQDSSFDGINVSEMFKFCTKFSSIIVNPAMTGAMIRKAIRFAGSGRPGPVHLNLPVDVMETDIDDTVMSSKRFLPNSQYCDRTSVKEAARRLLNSKRVAMLLGNGVSISGAAEEARRFAELLRIPVATTPKAKGIFPDNHPLSLGVFGCAGSLLSDSYLLNSDGGSKKLDCILAIGTSFSEWSTHTWDTRLKPADDMIQIDIDHNEVGKNYPFCTALIGDAKVALKSLVFETKRQLEKAGKKAADNITERESSFREFKAVNEKYVEPEKILSENEPVLPQRLMRDIRSACPDDTIFFVDIGNNWAWATHYLDILRPDSFFTGLGFASMGYAAAASIGAKFAAPERPVVAIVGDGGFLMNGMEVSCAVNYNRQVIWIVLNDAGYGMIYHGRKMRGLPDGFSTRYKQVDFVKMAESLGARGIRISRPGELNETLIGEIIETGMPTVIDVLIDGKQVPPIQSRIGSLNNMYTYDDET